MKNLLSCNLGSYRKHRPRDGDVRAYEHLQSLGIEYVEIPVPPKEEIDSIRSLLDRFGLRPLTLLSRCDLSRPDLVEVFQPQVESATAMGVSYLFASVKAGDMPKTVAYGRLREVGDLCARHNLTICLETHPDLAQNGEEALRTMRGVNHPHVRINFDTANVYYYNEGIDAVKELSTIREYVASVHLKDTNGGYRVWHFPPLGRGVVDFPAVFRMLNEGGMHGPFTMELEGIEGEELDFEQTCAQIRESVEYITSIRE